MFVYSPTFSTFKKKNNKESEYVIGNQKSYLKLNFFHYMVFFYLRQNVKDLLMVLIIVMVLQKKSLVLTLVKQKKKKKKSLEFAL